MRAVCTALTFIYLPFVISDVGMPTWGAPWWPTEGGVNALLLTVVVMLVLWANGWFLQGWLSRRKLRDPNVAPSSKFETSAFGRFLVRACLLYAGAPAGAGLSFAAHDSRYAIVFAALSALMILLLPRPKSPSASALPA